METPTLWTAIKINWARFEWYRHCVDDFYIGPDLAWKVRVFRDCEKRRRLPSTVREGKAVVEASALAEGGTEAAGTGRVV